MAEQQTFRAALKEARSSFDKASSRLRAITYEAQHLKEEIGRLRRTITALAAMCSESPDTDKLGITDACTEVMESYPMTMTTMDVVNALDAMGYDLTSQKNIAASVHAVLSRLAKSGKITKLQDDGNEVVNWRGPNYNASLESGSITDEDIPF